jgi:integrase
MTVRQLPSGSWRWRVAMNRKKLNKFGVLVLDVQSGVCQTRREAERAEARARAEKPQGDRAQRVPTVSEWIDRWLATKTLSPSTLYCYESIIESRLRPVLGSIHITELTVEHVENMLNEMQNLKDPAKALGKNTRRQAREILSGALREAQRRGFVTVNVARLALPPSGVAPKKMAPPSVDGAKRARVSAAKHGPTAALLIELALQTGGRRGELVELKWTDVDWEGASITISRACTVVKKQRVSKPTKTGSVRPIPLGEATMAMLSAHKARLDAILGTESVWVIADEPGHPWPPDRATNVWQTIRKDAKLPDVRLHDLRHFVATQLLAAGLSAKEVAERLGHADASMTLRVYAHATDEGARRATEVISGLLG